MATRLKPLKTFTIIYAHLSCALESNSNFCSHWSTLPLLTNFYMLVWNKKQQQTKRQIEKIDKKNNGIKRRKDLIVNPVLQSARFAKCCVIKLSHMKKNSHMWSTHHILRYNFVQYFTFHTKVIEREILKLEITTF